MASARIANTAKWLLQTDSVWHYHTKLMAKHEKRGGSFEWHQDYGYWYQNGLLFPDLLTAFIAIDQCTHENGALQVLRGSHHCGRLEHGKIGGQTGICDLERMEYLKKKLDTVHVIMNSGDVLFFSL